MKKIDYKFYGNGLGVPLLWIAIASFLDIYCWAGLYHLQLFQSRHGSNQGKYL